MTTGAANDIERATSTARAMVTQFGMSPRLGALKFGQESGEVFLGRDMGHQRDYSEEIAGVIDERGAWAHRDRPRRGLRDPRAAP